MSGGGEGGSRGRHNGRPMTPLRAKYIRDLVIHGRSKHTQEAYTRYVCDLARYYRRSPELISYEEVTGWLYHLIKERQLSASSVNIAVSAVRFLDHGRATNVLDKPVSALRHLVDILVRDQVNPPLAAGEIVTTGTLTRALPVSAGETWTTELTGVELDGICVRFA